MAVNFGYYHPYSFYGLSCCPGRYCLCCPAFAPPSISSVPQLCQHGLPPLLLPPAVSLPQPFLSGGGTEKFQAEKWLSWATWSRSHLQITPLQARTNLWLSTPQLFGRSIASQQNLPLLEISMENTFLSGPTALEEILMVCWEGHLTVVVPQSLLNWRCWEYNLGPSACKAGALWFTKWTSLASFSIQIWQAERRNSWRGLKVALAGWF